MTPADYLRVVVLPTLAEMLAEPMDQRRAYLACITAAHLVDHVQVGKGLAPEDKRLVRREVRAVSLLVAGALEIVEAVATGVKHAQPNPKPKPKQNPPVQFSPGAERVVPAFVWDGPHSAWGHGRWGGAGLLVETGGRHWFVDDAVRITVQGFALAFPDLLAGVDLGPALMGDQLSRPPAPQPDDAP